MRTDTRLGTFEEVVADVSPEVREIAALTRALVIARDPETVEVPRPGERMVAYGLGPKKMSEAYAFLAPHRSWVTFGFFHATSLPDPEGLLEGTGARIRHVKLRDAADPGRPAPADLLDAAILERRRALGR